MKERIADSISFKVIQRNNISKEESDFIEQFNLEQQLLLTKIEEISVYLHVDTENVIKSFIAWLRSNDSFINDPISYWKTNLTAAITFNNESIKLEESCSIELHILVLPGSEAICERCFSQLTLIHNHLRNSLKSDLLDCMLQIMLNLIWAQNMTEIDSIIKELNENDDKEEEEDIDEEYY